MYPTSNTSQIGLLQVTGFSRRIVHADEKALAFYKNPTADFPRWDHAWKKAEEAIDEIDFDANVQIPSPRKGALNNLKIVFTGEPSGISRPDIESLIKDCGGKVVSAVSGLTNYLVIGGSCIFQDGRDLIIGNKYKKAKEIIAGLNTSNLHIINESELYNLIKNRPVPAPTEKKITSFFSRQTKYDTHFETSPNKVRINKLCFSKIN